MENPWDQRYLGGDAPWDTGRPTTELVRVLDEHGIRPCRALDVACGTGANAVFLALRGFDVTAVDISPTAIARASRRAAEADTLLRFIEADVFNLPDLGDPFPFICDVGGYHAMRRVDEARLLAVYDRLIAPEGLMLVLAGNAKEPMKPGPPTVSETEIRRAFEPAFQILQLREFRFDSAPDRRTHPLGWSVLMRSRKSR